VNGLDLNAIKDSLMDVIGTLYGWYVEKWERDDVLAQPARVALRYEGTDLVPKMISRQEFIRWLSIPSLNPRIKQMWINGFVCGHETELAAMPESVKRYVRDCVKNPPTFLDAETVFRDAS
jgi:hypothetical protein